MQECDAMDGERGYANLFAAFGDDANSFEVGMKKMMSMTSKHPEDCAVPTGM